MSASESGQRVSHRDFLLVHQRRAQQHLLAALALAAGLQVWTVSQGAALAPPLAGLCCLGLACAVKTCWHLRRHTALHLACGIRRTPQVMWAALGVSAAVLLTLIAVQGSAAAQASSVPVLCAALLWVLVKQVPYSLGLEVWLARTPLRPPA